MGVLRFAASAGLRTAQFGLQTYLQTGRRMVGAVTPEPARALARELERAARESPAIAGVARRIEEVVASNEYLNAATNALRGFISGPMRVRTRPALPTLKESGADRSAAPATSGTTSRRTRPTNAS